MSFLERHTTSLFEEETSMDLKRLLLAALNKYYSTKESKYYTLYLFIREAYYSASPMEALKVKLDSLSADGHECITTLAQEFGYLI